MGRSRSRSGKKLLENLPKIALYTSTNILEYRSTQCVFCLYTLLKVDSYYDLIVLSKSAMGFGYAGGWVGWALSTRSFILEFLDLFNFAKHLIQKRSKLTHDVDVVFDFNAAESVGRQADVSPRILGDGILYTERPLGRLAASLPPCVDRFPIFRPLKQRFRIRLDWAGKLDGFASRHLLAPVDAFNNLRWAWGQKTQSEGPFKCYTMLFSWKIYTHLVTL